MPYRDEHGERTEQPTKLRRREARQRGQVARSADLTAAVAVLAAMAMLSLLVPPIIEGLKVMTARLLAGGEQSGHLQSARAALAGSITAVVGPAALLAGSMVAVAVLANIAQVGFLFTTEPLRMDLARLSPAAGLGRLLSGWSLVRLAMGVAKIGAVAVVAAVTIRPAWGQFARTAAMPAGQIVQAGCDMIFRLAVRLGAVLLILAVVDYLCRRRQLEGELRMTRQEVRDELKSTEGDPAVRSRRRRIASQAAQRPTEMKRSAGVNDA